MAPHWRLVVRYMPRTTPTLVAVGGLVLLGAMGSVAMAWAVGVVMDLLTDGSAQEFTIWALILLALELARVLVETTYYWLTALRVEQFARNLRAGLMDHIMKVRLIVSEQIHSGNIVSTINSDVEASAWAPVTLANMAGDILTACAALSLMLVSNWRLGLACVAASALTALVGLLGRQVSALALELQEAKALATALCRDALMNLEIVKAYRLEHYLAERLTMLFGRVLLAVKRLAASTGVIMGAGQLAGFMPQFVAFGYGGYLAISGAASLGTVLACVVLSNYVAMPLAQIGGLMGTLKRQSGAASRVARILSLEPEGLDSMDAMTARLHARPTLVVRNLAFGYGSKPECLRDISFAAQGEGMVGVVGGSGSGKTTLLKLLAGLYEPSAGVALVGGIAPFRLHGETRRALIAWCPQDPVVLTGTIRDNLTMAKADLTDAEMERAIAASGCDELLAHPDRLGRWLAEGGRNLSTGQRQRLCLARALLTGASVLLLDEPTSALDQGTESHLLETLNDLKDSHLIVVSTHRVEIIADADTILVLSDGRLAEQGTHVSLLAQGGHYWELLRQRMTRGDVVV